MRSDYMLYAVAIIFFILTGAVAAIYWTEQQLWVVTTAVLGLVFIGLGYTQRPKPTTTAATVTTTTSLATTAPAPPAPQPTLQPAPTPMQTEEVETPTPVPTVEVPPPTPEIMKVKGIGVKREAQLKALGINSIEDLAKASAKDLATRLQISPKITGKWIENAKAIAEKL